MQNFTELERIDPERRGSNERIKDYKEIYEIFKTNDAATQAERCIQCGDPYCHNKCPLHNYIPFWLKATANIDKKLAFNLSNESNPFPEITGRICPVDRLCEGDCTLNQDGFGAITIGSIETFISENEVGKDISFSEISKRCNGIFIGIGAQKPKKANIINEQSSGTLRALDFLINIQKKLFHESYDKKYDVKDKSVVVIGGGDTAMDCVRTAIREGAKPKEIILNSDKGVIVDEHYETSKKGIFAGGDCQRGADLVVTAANDGKEAAHFIIKSLKRQEKII